MRITTPFDCHLFRTYSDTDKIDIYESPSGLVLGIKIPKKTDIKKKNILKSFFSFKWLTKLFKKKEEEGEKEPDFIVPKNMESRFRTIDEDSLLQFKQQILDTFSQTKYSGIFYFVVYGTSSLTGTPIGSHNYGTENQLFMLVYGQSSEEGLNRYYTYKELEVISAVIDIPVIPNIGSLDGKTFRKETPGMRKKGRRFTSYYGRPSVFKQEGDKLYLQAMIVTIRGNHYDAEYFERNIVNNIQPQKAASVLN